MKYPLDFAIGRTIFFGPIAFDALQEKHFPELKIIKIDACKIDPQDPTRCILILDDEEKIKAKLRAIKTDLETEARPCLIEFSIPSPCDSKLSTGETVKHSVTAWIKDDTIEVHDPMVTQAPKDGSTISFPPKIISLLSEVFPSTKISENRTPLQNPGEKCCAYIAAKKAQYYSLGNFPNRKQIEDKDWAEDAKLVNQSIQEGKIGKFAVENEIPGTFTAQLYEAINKIYPLSQAIKKEVTKINDGKFFTIFCIRSFGDLIRLFYEKLNYEQKYDLFNFFYRYYVEPGISPFQQFVKLSAEGQQLLEKMAQAIGEECRTKNILQRNKEDHPISTSTYTLNIDAFEKIFETLHNKLTELWNGRLTDKIEITP